MPIAPWVSRSAFCDDSVPRLAKNDADAGLIVRVTKDIVYG
jgi:hypothetical protein